MTRSGNLHFKAMRKVCSYLIFPFHSFHYVCLPRKIKKYATPAQEASKVLCLRVLRKVSWSNKENALGCLHLYLVHKHFSVLCDVKTQIDIVKAKSRTVWKCVNWPAFRYTSRVCQTFQWTCRGASKSKKNASTLCTPVYRLSIPLLSMSLLILSGMKIEWKQQQSLLLRNTWTGLGFAKQSCFAIKLVKFVTLLF